MEFERPLLVSYGSSPDQLVIELERMYFLIPEGEDSTHLTASRLILRSVLPKMLASEEEY